MNKKKIVKKRRLVKSRKQPTLSKKKLLITKLSNEYDKLTNQSENIERKIVGMWYPEGTKPPKKVKELQEKQDKIEKRLTKVHRKLNKLRGY